MRKYMHDVATDHAIHACTAVGVEYWATAGAGVCWGVTTTAGVRHYVYLRYRKVNAAGHIRVEAYADHPPMSGTKPLAAAVLHGWLPQITVTATQAHQDALDAYAAAA